LLFHPAIKSGFTLPTFSLLAAFVGTPKWLLAGLNVLDSFLTKIPGVKLLAWQFIFELHKEK
jgi:hypothetical protein